MLYIELYVKLLPNRLKVFLHDDMSCSQSAFIPNRLVTDKVFLGYERLHELRAYELRKGGIVTLNMDISKKRVFLEQVMLRLGFSLRCVQLLLACTTSSTFSSMFN